MKGTEFEGRPVEDVVKSSFFGNPGLFNNAGQHYNHLHFWKWMKPGGGGMPGNLEKQIIADLGSVAKMKEDFIAAGVTQFGSGWCWLAVKFGRIEVMKTANGESPLIQGAAPILGCDAWEHAIISTTATAGPTISRLSSITWSTGNASPKCSPPWPNSRPGGDEPILPRRRRRCRARAGFPAA